MWDVVQRQKQRNRILQLQESVTIKSGRMGGPGGFGGSGEVTQGTTEDATENNAEVTEESDTASEDGAVLSE